MITFGVDAHKKVHVALALSESGKELGEWRGPNSREGWAEVLSWSNGFDDDVQWGIEGAWGTGRGLAQHLIQAGATVYEINARWTAAGRRKARRQGKTDSLDARAVALLVRQEAPDLPRVYADDDTAILDLLTTEREAAVEESTRLRNRIHALLLQIDPQYRSHLASLGSAAGLRALETYVSPSKEVLQVRRAESVRRLAQRLRLVVDQVKELGAQIRALAASRFSPLTRLCGVNLLTAGTLAGILGPGWRFRSDAQLAAYAGVAPLEASSAGHVRHRLNRGGNRRLNSVLYRIALTQAHHHPEARAYILRRISEGKTRREAHRCLRRYIARALWHLWKECQILEEPHKDQLVA